MQKFDPQEFEKQQKEMLARTKISLYITVGWGLVALFLMVGLFVNKDAAVIGMMIVSTVWVQLEIINRAAASLHVLRHWNEMVNPPSPNQEPSAKDEEEK